MFQGKMFLCCSQCLQNCYSLFGMFKIIFKVLLVYIYKFSLITLESFNLRYKIFWHKMLRFCVNSNKVNSIQRSPLIHDLEIFSFLLKFLDKVIAVGLYLIFIVIFQMHSSMIYMCTFSISVMLAFEKFSLLYRWQFQQSLS